MTTVTAYLMTLFSGAVVLLAAIAWALLRRRREARKVAFRIGVTFAVFALAAGYVWLEVGPALDHRLEARERPLLPRSPPPAQDV
jgi:hypothetical protein